MTSFGIHSDCPAGICLLADHLDAALAIGEDLMTLSLAPRIDLDEADPATSPEAVEQFVQTVSRLEKLMIMRVLQARRRLPEVDDSDRLIASTISLLQAQTDVLLDLIEQVGDRDRVKKFDGGSDAFAYLRAKGLISPEAAAPSPYESVDVTEAFRVGGVIELGPLLDMIAQMLDLLDARYGLYVQVPVGDEGTEEREHGASGAPDAGEQSAEQSEPQDKAEDFGALIASVVGTVGTPVKPAAETATSAGEEAVEKAQGQDKPEDEAKALETSPVSEAPAPDVAKLPDAEKDAGKGAEPAQTPMAGSQTADAGAEKASKPQDSDSEKRTGKAPSSPHRSLIASIESLEDRP
ncbi:MAG: hypothetical protein R3D67_09735 [Hyphomicrobiaceae bacterium]